ncbi:MAG: hypothetical protein IT374_15880 [Polyangiaceae bacterium]|nr:hypothetical protein [Polyangiaceae bacterium]
MSDAHESPTCPRCGAPQKPGYALCPFCRAAYSEQAARHAIPCKKCGELSAWGQSRCVRCREWIVVQCLFCNNVSPHTVSGCLACGEAFQGMQARKAARDAEVSRQRTLQTVGAWGPVGASFLGSVAGAYLGSGGHHHHEHHDWQDDGATGSYDAGGDDGGSVFESVSDAFSSSDGGGWFD